MFYFYCTLCSCSSVLSCKKRPAALREFWLISYSYQQHRQGAISHRSKFEKLAMKPRNLYLQLLLCSLLPLAALANYEIVDGPGSGRPDLFCNESWVAFENKTGPFFHLCIVPGPPPTPTQEPGSGSALGSAMQPQLQQLVSGWPSCFLLVGVNDTRVLDQTDGVLILGIILDPDNTSNWEYHPVLYFEEESQRPVICATPPPPFDDKVEFSLPLLIVIYISTSISILSSIAFLVTYILFKSLRTLPGLVIMNLVLSFLLGDLLVQIRLGHEYNEITSWESLILNEYFYLARFIWMSLTGIEMCRSLYKGVRLDIGNQRLGKYTTLLIYMLIGWGIPAILAIIMYGVEKSTKVSEEVKDWFGAPGYLTQYVPFALTQLINIAIVVFITVIFWGAIKRQRRLNSTIKRQEVNFVRVFLILITVLGLLWIMLFVLLHWKSLLAVQIIFVIIVTPQPLLVCIAFVCTKKVGRMYLTLFGIGKYGSKRASSRQNTLTSLYSDRELLKRGKTVTSMVSEKELSLPSWKEKKQLHTISEEVEVTSIPEKEDLDEKPQESIALGNEKDTSKSNGLDINSNGTDVKSNGTDVKGNGTDVKSNGNVQSNGPSSPSHVLNPNREESPV